MVCCRKAPLRGEWLSSFGIGYERCEQHLNSSEGKKMGPRGLPVVQLLGIKRGGESRRV